jgi:hypothetical protein
MKKTVSVLLIAMAIVFVACGPGKDKLALIEKAKQDSIAKAALNQVDFKVFLQSFIQSLKESKSQNNIVHKSIGVYIYKNPGVFCSAEKSDEMADMDKEKGIPTNNIFDRQPKGSFCEGYPGEKDGFYYYETTKEEMPSYYDAKLNADKKVVLPANLNYQKFVKVNAVMGGYFSADLYFTCIDSNWYLIGQSFCDCSA